MKHSSITDDIKLGDEVRDMVSGFSGIAVSEHKYLHGCSRITVQPCIDKDGKLPDTATFDEPQLEIITPKKVMFINELNGGTEKYSDEGRSLPDEK